jgi:hypothetical protein
MGVLMTFNPFSALTSKVFGGLLLLSLVTLGPALLITRAKLSDARETIAALEQWQDDIVIAVRLASGNADTTDKTAEQQINRMGVIRIKLGEAVESQNGQIEAMQRESDAALAIADKAREERAAAILRAEKLQAELRSRARVPAPAEDMEAAVRRSQDELYEAGL